MKFYPAGEVIVHRLLDLPLQHMEWIVTGAEAGEMVAAGFHRHAADETCFVHAESGDVYQLARRQYLDRKTGRLKYRCDAGVTLEDELATRPLTILAMASDAEDIVDPFDGQEDLVAGVLRHVTPFYRYRPQYLLLTAVWAARLRPWGFRVAHSTFRLMKKMVAGGAIGQLPRQTLSDTVLEAVSSPRPSEFFRVLQTCDALPSISSELADLFEKSQSNHMDKDIPSVLRVLDEAAAETANVSSIIKIFYDLLAEDADSIFEALGLKSLRQGAAGKIDNAD